MKFCRNNRQFKFNVFKHKEERTDTHAVKERRNINKIQYIINTREYQRK